LNTIKSPPNEAEENESVKERGSKKLVLQLKTEIKLVFKDHLIITGQQMSNRP